MFLLLLFSFLSPVISLFFLSSFNSFDGLKVVNINIILYCSGFFLFFKLKPCAHNQSPENGLTNPQPIKTIIIHQGDCNQMALLKHNKALGWCFADTNTAKQSVCNLPRNWWPYGLIRLLHSVGWFSAHGINTL